jgi:putative methionine-R-sulfoxide reductase with GAF domain
MKTDYFLIIQAIVAFFMCVFMISQAQRTKETVFNFISLFFFLILVRAFLAWAGNLTLIDLVPVTDTKESIFKTMPDPAKAALYDFRIFTWMALEIMLPMAYAYFIIPKVLISQRKENLARRARIIMRWAVAAIIIFALSIIIPSLHAGAELMYKTDNTIIELIKTHIGYHLLAALHIAIPAITIWFINEVWGTAITPARAFSRYPGILVTLLVIEIGFTALSWVINPFFHSAAMLIEFVPLGILVYYARKLVTDLYIQAQDRMESVQKERHLIVSLIRKIGGLISTENFSMSSVSEDIIGSAVRILNASSGAVFMIEQEGNKKFLRAQSVIGLYPPKKRSTIVGTESQINDRVLHETIALGEGIIGGIAQSGQSLFIPDTLADERYEQTLPDMVTTTSFMAVPLMLQDEVFGVIAVTSDMGNFRQDDFTLLEILANFDHMAFTINRYAHHMNELVRVKTAEVENLLEIQNGDYYLTSLLTKPLMVNEAKSPKTRVDYCLDQKKKFTFRKWNAEIGGDICIAHRITLRSKKYTVFTNADAMGKSIQGAGGAIVYGVAFLSNILRTIENRTEQDSTPSAWLEQIFRDLQALFESFDGSMLMSAVIGLIEEDSGMMWHFNCEHPWVVRYRNGKAEFVDSDDKTGRKIGTIGIAEMHIQEQQLDPGDVIILGSDGRDDVLIGFDESTGNRIINEDETLFLRHVEAAKGSPREIASEVAKSGELTDDLSLMRVCYLGKDGGVTIESSATRDKLNGILYDALALYRKGEYVRGRAVLGTVGNLAETNDDRFKVAHLLGNFYYREKRFEEALENWREALAYNPDNVQIQRNVEILEKQMGKEE